MPKKWTRGERKEQLKERFRHRREKLFAMMAVVVVFLLLLALLAYGISAQADPFLLVVLAIIIVVLIPVSVFFIDMLHWEI
jgi:fatty acid desaturase